MAGLYDEKILGLRQQREFARKIREQASQGVEAGLMVSGHYVPNYGGMVANAMRQIMAGYEEGKAQNQEEDLTRQKLADSIKYMNQAGIEAPPSLLAQAGTKAVEPSFFDSAGAFLTGKKPPETIPAQPYQQNVAQNVTPDQYEHAMAGALGINTDIAAPMVAMYQAKQNRALKESEDAYRKSHDEAVLAQQVAQKDEDRRLRKELADQADATRRDTAALIHSGQNNNAPAPTIVEIQDPKDPTQLIKIDARTNNVIGYSGKTPAAIKDQEKLDAALAKKASASDTFSEELGNLKNSYKYLNEHGGITNSANSPLTNLSAYTSEITGPSLGKMFGTANQAQRNSIEDARKRMLPLFKEATGMSSKQMDSNAELKSAKDTLTNPNADFGSIMKSIDALEKHWGSSSINTPRSNTENKQQSLSVDDLVNLYTPKGNQ